MTITNALCERLKDDYGIQVHTHYSGRGMRGKECFGISGDGKAIHSFYSAMYELAQDDAFFDEANEFWDRKHTICMDDMGLGVIIYFPSIQVKSNDEEWEDYDDEED